MPQVISSDIIANLSATQNFTQGESKTYTINLYRNTVGNYLRANAASTITFTIIDSSGATLSVFSTATGGTNLPLTISTVNQGDITFTIPVTASAYYPAGKIFAKIAIEFANFYPRGITYNFSNLELGDVALSATGGVGLDETSEAFREPVYTLESVDITRNPGLGGKVVFNSGTPSAITQIKLSNLDANGVRLSQLENFLKKLTIEKARGRIKIINKTNTALYAIYNVGTYTRIDSYAGSGGDNEDNDSIAMNVTFEEISTGSAVNRSIFQVGDVITYETDQQGLILDDVPKFTKEDEGKTSSVTSGNGARTGITLTSAPHENGNVTINVNGLQSSLGDAVKTKECYFSRDSGTTALTISSLTVGDELIWNGTVAGYELDATDKIDVIYEK
jgi:hypothetical protein